MIALACEWDYHRDFSRGHSVKVVVSPSSAISCCGIVHILDFPRNYETRKLGWVKKVLGDLHSDTQRILQREGKTGLRWLAVQIWSAFWGTFAAKLRTCCYSSRQKSRKSRAIIEGLLKLASNQMCARRWCFKMFIINWSLEDFERNVWGCVTRSSKPCKLFHLKCILTLY